ELFKHVSETYNTKLFLISNKSCNETMVDAPSLFENLSVSNTLNKVTSDSERLSIYVGLSYCNFIHKTSIFTFLY
mgnify:CR=1